MRSSLASLVAVSSLVFGCTQDGLDGEDGGADLAGQDEKGDAIPGIEVQGRLRPATPIDTVLTTAVPRPGFVFYAAEGSTVTVEVTRAGSAAGLDTLLKIYGPRLADGSYPKTLATDEDAGYGKLSKIGGLQVSIPGFYLVELTNGGAATAPAANAKARLKLSCTGVCDSDLPVQPLGLDIRWYQRSAERRGISLQAYAAATAAVEARASAGGLPASWGVVMDIDETTLDNSAYQKRRSDLGTGYSPASWTAWVNEKAATPIAGALAFTKRVKQLGGKVVWVTNRMDATECAPTRDNLTATGFVWDGMHCKTGSSDKNARFATVAMGMEVVAFVGDNIQDFPALTQDVRKQPDSAYAKFGDEYFLIPNPMYGSFEKNAD
jgi:5'-nucleotidase (lipoprotein e(P4) family)